MWGLVQAQLSLISLFIIGETILIPTSVGRQLIAAIIGALVYSTLFAVALKLGLHPWDFKLASAVFILIAIVLLKLLLIKTRVIE